MVLVRFEGGRLDGRWLRLDGSPPATYEATPLQVLGRFDEQALVRRAGVTEVYDLYRQAGGTCVYILRPGEDADAD